jgi:hypothetical protein
MARSALNLRTVFVYVGATITVSCIVVVRPNRVAMSTLNHDPLDNKALKNEPSIQRAQKSQSTVRAILTQALYGLVSQKLFRPMANKPLARLRSCAVDDNRNVGMTMVIEPFNDFLCGFKKFLLCFLRQI